MCTHTQAASETWRAYASSAAAHAGGACWGASVAWRVAPQFRTPPAACVRARQAPPAPLRRTPRPGAARPMMLTERRRAGRSASTHRVAASDNASLLRSPVPDLGLGHSSEEEAEAWAEENEVRGLRCCAFGVNPRLRSRRAPSAACLTRVPPAAAVRRGGQRHVQRGAAAQRAARGRAAARVHNQPAAPGVVASRHAVRWRALHGGRRGGLRLPAAAVRCAAAAAARATAAPRFPVAPWAPSAAGRSASRLLAASRARRPAPRRTHARCRCACRGPRRCLARAQNGTAVAG